MIDAGIGIDRDQLVFVQRRFDLFLRVRRAETVKLGDVQDQRVFDVPFLLAFIGQLDAGFDPPEQVGRHRDIAVGGEAVAQIAHDPVNAEYFLQHDDSGA